ncbi:MAG: ImmA/IrrE family metallo-endopeptidase [Negativibacillus sp.]
MGIKETVTELCRKYGTRDPFEIARQCNIIVLFEPLGTINGYYGKTFRQPVIHINQDLDDPRQFWTCCHELGHAILHPTANTPFLRENTLFSIDRYEVEANRFATCLLYPAELLLSEYEGCSSQQISESLGIPADLVEYSLKK